MCIHVHVHVGYISLYNDCQSENDDDSDCCSNPLRLSNVYNSTSFFYYLDSSGIISMVYLSHDVGPTMCFCLYTF